MSDMAMLAQRIHERWQEYRRLHPGHSVPISDTLSRILEHAPTYVPMRKRLRTKERKPIQNPGIFTVQQIAQDLGTTVGDLLGEQGHQSPIPQWSAAYVAAAEGVVIGYIEELPGAHAQGATLEEARVNLREALQMMLRANRRIAAGGFENLHVLHRERIGG